MIDKELHEIANTLIKKVTVRKELTDNIMCTCAVYFHVIIRGMHHACACVCAHTHTHTPVAHKHTRAQLHISTRAHTHMHSCT